MRLETAKHTAGHITRVLGLLTRFRFALLATAMFLTPHPAVLAQRSAHNGAQTKDAVMVSATKDTSICTFSVFTRYSP